MSKSVKVFSQDGQILLHMYTNVTSVTTGPDFVQVTIDDTNDNGEAIHPTYSFSNKLPYIVYKPAMMPDPELLYSERYLAKAYFDVLKNFDVIKRKGPYVTCDKIQMPKALGFSKFVEFLSSLDNPKAIVDSLDRELYKVLEEEKS